MTIHVLIANQCEVKITRSYVYKVEKSIMSESAVKAKQIICIDYGEQEYKALTLTLTKH